MNVKLLRKVAKHIAAEPKRYCFDWELKDPDVPCGTKACIAGWTIILGAGLKEPFDENGQIKIPQSLRTTGFGGHYSKPARELLDITQPQAARLFLYWPRPFDSSKDDAATAVKRIEHFIKTKGK